MRTKIYRIIFLSVFISQIAEARFTHTDANHIDLDHKLSSEAYLDKASYQYTLRSQWEWDKKHNGYRTSPGSLSGNRFNFHEEIKLSTKSEAQTYISIYQLINQDIREDKVYKHLKISQQLHEYFDIAIFGDGDTYKKWGDLGGSALFKFSKNFKCEFYYFSVDHFYNSKVEDPERHYNKKPVNFGTDISYDLDDFKYTLKVEYDDSLEWESELLGESYEHHRKQFDVKAQFNIPNSQTISYQIITDQKFEKIETTNTQLGYKQQSLNRELIENHLSYVSKNEDNSYRNFGLKYIDINSQYENEFFNIIIPELKEKLFNPTTTRKEWLGYAEFNSPISSSKQWFFQKSLYVSHVAINKENEDLKLSNEVKFQTAFEYVFANSSLVFNANWDIDSLVENFPYKNDKKFLPWNGGNLQAQIIF